MIPDSLFCDACSVNGFVLRNQPLSWRHINDYGGKQMKQSTGCRLHALLLGGILLANAALGHAESLKAAKLDELAKQLEIGDMVFIRIPHQPFLQVADTTSSWTNHVGIVADISNNEPVIAESRVPLSGVTGWSSFVRRSDLGRVAVTRLPIPLDALQQSKLKQAVAARNDIVYDTGFDLHSNRQFCSRYVREVLREATGVEVGEVEPFATLLQHNPRADQRFWRVWYFGHIPWQRETITPASLLRDGRMRVVFDGQVQ
jgi:hypothetical protein